MLAHYAAGYLLHHRFVQGVRIMPHVAGLEGRADNAAKHGVAIAFGPGGLSGMKCSGNLGGFKHANRRWQNVRSEEHTSELQSRSDLVCRLLLEKKKKKAEKNMKRQERKKKK